LLLLLSLAFGFYLSFFSSFYLSFLMYVFHFSHLFFTSCFCL
jgi:hypothetical protein